MSIRMRNALAFCLAFAAFTTVASGGDGGFAHAFRQELAQALAAGTIGAGDVTGVTAGDGLTGGGSSGSVSLAVGAGTGLTASADAIGLTSGQAPAQLAAITTAAVGDMLIYGPAGWQALPKPSTAGHVLEWRPGTHGLGAGWAAPAGGGLDVVKVRATSGQTVTNGATDLLTYHVEDVDTAGVSPVGAGASTIVLTTGAAGEVHDVTATVAISTSMVAQASFQIRLYDTDGTTILARSVLYGTSDTWFYRAVTGKFVSTAANQTIRVALGHTSGASRTTDTAVIAGDVGVVAVRVR